MNKYIAILRKALADPKIEGLDCLIPEKYHLIARAIENGASYVSEFLRNGAGKLRYEYHVHNSTFGRRIKKICDEGKTSSRPKLVNVYTQQQLEELIYTGSKSS